MDTIYADYQATTPVDQRVVEAMVPYWGGLFGNPHSADHIVGWRASEAVTHASEAISNMIGADPDEVVFTSGATEANNLALLGLSRKKSNTRDRILVGAIEHKCVLASAAAAAQEGMSLEVIPVDRYGFVDMDYLSAQIDENVLVVSIMAVNNEIGTIQDIPSIASVLGPYGVLFHCDAAQAPCAMSLKNLAKHADLISLSGHKFYGPQGIGALYIRREIQNMVEPLHYGGGQQAGMRSGTVPLALTVGLGTAAAIMNTPEGPQERARVQRQRDLFVELIQREEISIEVNGPTNYRRHPGNANLRFPGSDAHDIIGRLQPRLAASTGSACTTGLPEQSHVLGALGLGDAEAASSVRFSFGRFTSDEDVISAARCVASVVK